MPDIVECPIHSVYQQTLHGKFASGAKLWGRQGEGVEGGVDPVVEVEGPPTARPYNRASAVVLDTVSLCHAASEPARNDLLLKTFRGGPSIPDGAKNCPRDPRWNQVRQFAQEPMRPSRMPSRCVLTDRVGSRSMFSGVLEIPTFQFVSKAFDGVLKFGRQNTLVYHALVHLSEFVLPLAG